MCLQCELQITYTIMFSLTNALVLGAQGPEQKGFMLALDSSFCQEFQQLVNLMNFHCVLLLHEEGLKAEVAQIAQAVK